MQTLPMLSSQEIRNFLKKTIFSQLDTKLVDKLLPLIERFKVTSGEVIRKIGDESGSLILVESGKFSASDADHSVLATYGEGECIGPLSVLFGGTQLLKTQATEESIIIVLDAGSLKMLEFSEPHLMLQIFRCIRLYAGPKFHAAEQLMLQLYQS